ncbi:MAG: transglutaminase-like domain-containing protein [Pyrinomonadaceae bacterium]
MIAFIAFVILAGSGFTLYWLSKPVEKTRDEVLAADIRDNAVLMLALPGFSGEEFRRQLIGKANIVKFVISKKDVYFSYPEGDEKAFDDFVASYFFDREKVEFGQKGKEKIEVGDYSFWQTPENHYFVKSKLDNVRIDAEQVLTFPFSTVNYSLSLGEMNGFINNSQVYGGKLITRAPERSEKPQIVFANHAIMVAKPEEPSLKRLVDQLLKDVGPSREERIQRLVDFVSAEIRYDYSEAVGSRETLKRASETLMTRSGDCSNKTILLASLLEQIGEEYILLYCPRHITVAVPQGEFTNENGLDFTWDQKNWVIAETTLPGFQVGTTRVAEPVKLTSVEYVQKPKLSDVIFDASSYEVLKFF